MIRGVRRRKQKIAYSNSSVTHNYLPSPPEWDDQQPQCKPRNSIIFLKTHKTAGSSIQNILMRYAENHGLLIALPFSLNYLGHPSPFKRTFVPRLKSGYSYNILCHHARFNFHEMRRVVNGNATFVTILREPAHVFESLFSYYKLKIFFNLTIENFAYGTRRALEVANERFYRKIGRNQMIFDLGLNEKHFDNAEAILMYVNYLDRKFDLVMIAERMMESLVLLQHHLCWEPEDMLMFNHNVRFNKLVIEPDIEVGLREFNRADQILYDYFDRRLTRKIAEFGVERMKREVEALEKKLKFWHDLCVEKEVNSLNLAFKFKPFSNQVYGFKLRANMTNSTCENLAKAELPFTSEMRRKQESEFYSFELMPVQKSRFLNGST
uniref:Galactose-3-O-sulfotransferase n=1 Tax=Strigamia maritima TaxID=126957 RepID=T1JN76_STRMM